MASDRISRLRRHERVARPKTHSAGFTHSCYLGNMERIDEFVDTRHKACCIHCGMGLTVEANEDHVPSKSLLDKPWPHHLPVVKICRECNSSFSKDEQYFVAFLQSVLTGSTDPAEHSNGSAARALAESAKLRERIEMGRTTYETLGGETRLAWKPEMERINRVIVKNARGHAYFEFGEPILGEPDRVWAVPLEVLTPSERDEFERRNEPDERSVWPEVGSRMLTRLITGQDMVGAWVFVQNGVYRYSAEQRAGFVVRSVLYEYLATEVVWHDE